MMWILAELGTIVIGDVLDGKYEITDILGEGAMGVVYLALHTRLGRSVALKTLRAEIAGDRDLVERFEREARAASAIGHPNIVQVFDAGGPPGLPYLVMEYLTGSSLGELLEAEGPLDVDRALALCQQALAGLEAAHGAGIVHRDLKPDNIFVCRDATGKEEVKILDFGISKILDKADPAIVGEGSATRAGMVMGTLLYMSPEQASGRQDIDHRTDLWALVCVLYECVSGTTPFPGDNYNQILAAVLRGEFVPLAKRAQGASASLSALVDRGLALDRESRFPDAASLRLALDAVSTGAQSTEAQDKMLAAFDNLADRFLEQEQGSAPAAASSRPSPGRLEPPRGDDRFAPPSATGPIALDLDIESSPRSLSREVAVAADTRSSKRPSKRSSSQMITRAAPTSRAASIGKVLVFVLLLAGGGLGYRYYTLGYIVPPTSAVMASLDLAVQPPGATVYLDGKLQHDSQLRLAIDESFELRLRADKRLARQQQFQTHGGETLRVQVRLPNTMPSIEKRKLVAPTRLEALEAPASDALIDSGTEKLRAYGRCAAPLWQAIGEAESSEARTEPMARALVDECVLGLRVTAGASPPMPELDEASLALATAITDFDRAARDLKNSAGASSKLLRSRKLLSAKTTKDLGHAETQWAGIESGTQAQWLALELSSVAKSEPNSMHSVLRELAVSSDSWMRAHLAGSDTETLRAATISGYSRAQEAASLDPAIYKASGADAFLRAIKPLLAPEPVEDPVFWHNQAIETFNQLLLPIEIKSPPQ